MSNFRSFFHVYGERLVAYAIGALVIIGLLPFASSAVVKPVISAIPTWIFSTTLMHLWMSLIQVWDDPSVTILGIPNRLFDAISLVAGSAMVASAAFYGSQTMATWGWLVLLFSLEGRLCERESWGRYRLKQCSDKQ